VLAVLCLSVLLTVVSNMALNVALPTLGRQLHAGVSSLAWVVDTYVLCFAGLLLPAGLAQLAVANLAKPLVARRGFRPVLAGGLAASAVGLLVLATAAATSPIRAAELGLGLLGVGIGLTMPPATGAIMSSLPPHKAGVGSAVNDLARELGGAFGIGVLGSLTLARYRSGLAPILSRQPGSVADQARTGLAQALAGLGGPHGVAGLAARDAYSSGLDLAMIVGAALVAVAAVAVYVALPGENPRQGRSTESAHPFRAA
jgi:MFS family permease